MTTNGASSGVAFVQSKVLHFDCDGCDASESVNKGEPRPKNWFLVSLRGRTGTKYVQLCPKCIESGTMPLSMIARLPIEARFGSPVKGEDGSLEKLFLPPLWEE